MLYYEPYADGNGKYYESPMAQGVRENYWAIFNNPHTEYMVKMPSKWHGSTHNFTYKEGVVNETKKPSDWLNAKSGKVDHNYDEYIGAYGQWRFLGYNLMGDSLTNPFFISDVGSTVGHKSDVGILNQDLYQGGYNKNNPAYQLLTKTRYDKKEYEEKKLKAIEKLMEKDSRFKTGKITQASKNNHSKVSTIVNNGKISAKLWANCLSLYTDPTTDTPLFKANREYSYLPGKNPDYFVWYTTIVGVTDKKLVNNLQIKSVIVRDENNNLIKRFDRDKKGKITETGTGSVSPGQQVKVIYEIENTGKNTTTINPSKIRVGIGTGANVYKNDYQNTEHPYKYNTDNWELTKAGVIKPKETKTFNETVTIPDDASVVRLTAYIHQDYIPEETGNQSDDWGHVIINVKNGDTGLKNIQLIDINGNVVKYMKPGETYKTRYTFQYKGPYTEFVEYRRVCNIFNQCWGERHRVPRTFTFRMTATRYLPNGAGTELYQKTETDTRYSVKPNTTWTYDTEYFVYEVPRADATASLQTPSEVTDTNSANNNGSKSWKHPYDIIVDNVRVYNKNERPIQNGTITLGLKYDITLVTPTQFPYFETDTKTHVTLPNGQVLEFIDHIKQGENKDITRELQVPVSVITSGSKQLNVSVFTNVDKKFWEKDLATQENNKGKDSTTQLPPLNPNESQGCPVVNNSNTFTVNHEINNYNGSTIRWSKFNNSASYSFYKYGKGNESTLQKTYNETYKINYVKFKSKYTTDKEYGTNGWVDLTKASEKDKAMIKAGYGYELAIEVEYKNNIFSTQPKAYDTRNGSTASGQTANSLSSKANVYKDIYVQTSDKKILSATGMYGTTSAFDMTIVKSDENSTVLRYTMKNTGNNNTMKIYTSENAKDGTYGLKVWTPVITGVGNPKKGQKELCDQESLSFKIQGSMYDDNQDSIIQ